MQIFYTLMIFDKCTYMGNQHTNHNVDSIGGICDQKTSKFFVPCGTFHGRTHGYKWSLFKVREGKYERGHGEAHGESGG
jgi:hypothetical protein